LVACRFDKIAYWRLPACFIACLLPLGIGHPVGFWNNLSQTVQALSSMALLVVLLGNGLLISRLFRAPALRYLGKVSYGVYLLHSLVFAAFLRSRLGLSVIQSGSALGAVLCMLAGFGLVLAIATVSFYLFESPFLRFKRYFEQDRSKQRVGVGESTNMPAVPIEVVQA
jgi:peptidoglycan/LPS O-acetylase OafA/YrhL